MAGASLWRGGEPLLLASTSPTRRALLLAAGIACDSEAPRIDERALEAGVAGGDPAAIAAGLAEAKALAVSRRRTARLVVGADQVLHLEGRLLHKAASAAEAVAQLVALSGRTHRLISAFAVARDGVVLEAGRAEACLTMRALDRAALSAYVERAGEAVLGSVGCYAVEGLGLHLFERIEGEHTTILGLPMLPLLAALRRLHCLSI